MKISKTIYFILIVSFTTSILFMGCESTQYPTPVPATEASKLSSKVLFINASADAPALNFFLNNTPAGTNVALGGNTAYNVTTVGSLQLKGKAATGTIGGSIGSGDLLFRAGATNNNNFAAASGINYSVFVTDTINRAKPTTLGATDPGGLRFLSVTDNLSAPASGNAHIRFFHLSSNAPAVWVSVSDTTKAIVSFANRAYRGIATTATATVPAVNFANFTPILGGTYSVEVRTGSATGPVALKIPALTLTSGKIYTIYAKGLAKGIGTKALGAGLVTHN
jgi:Domain of unknown function (DUF4397)